MDDTQVPVPEAASICVADFCGNYYQPGHWADYDPATGRVVFGGSWEGLCDLLTDHEPTEDEIYDYVRLQRQQS